MEPDVRCKNCTMQIRPEDALIRSGMPFCDEWCANDYVTTQTTQTDEIVCPFCGYEFEESFNYLYAEVVECENCTRRFELETTETITYTTRKIDWLQRWKAYNREQIYRAEWHENNGNEMEGD